MGRSFRRVSAFDDNGLAGAKASSALGLVLEFAGWFFDEDVCEVVVADLEDFGSGAGAAMVAFAAVVVDGDAHGDPSGPGWWGRGLLIGAKGTLVREAVSSVFSTGR
jgi:hypothetical protein